MYKIAVIGDRDSIYGFATVGLDIYPVEEHAQAVRLLKNLSESGYAIIYVTEGMYAQLDKELEIYKERPLPAILPIPGVSGNSGLGVKAVRKSVEQAVGSDILFGDKS